MNTLFGKASPNDKLPEHTVIIHFQYGIESLDPLHNLESRLRDVLSGKGVGVHDGHEIAMDSSDGFLYLYGPNAEKLFKEIKETLESTDFMTGAMATLIFGPLEEGVTEIEVRIG